MLNIHEFRATRVGWLTLGLRKQTTSRKEVFSMALREISGSVNGFSKESFVEVCLLLSINLANLDNCEWRRLSFNLPWIIGCKIEWTSCELVLDACKDWMDCLRSAKQSASLAFRLKYKCCLWRIRHIQNCQQCKLTRPMSVHWSCTIQSHHWVSLAAYVKRKIPVHPFRRSKNDIRKSFELVHIQIKNG